MIVAIQSAVGDPFSKAEACAFHTRKVIEGIAFGCLVAVENGIKHVPVSAKGKWNAEQILTDLQAKGLKAFPSPSIIRQSSKRETGFAAIIEGVPERRLSVSELISYYQETHKWLHEINPYVVSSHDEFLAKHAERLPRMTKKINAFIERHTISISGEMFYCTLRDKIDGQTKVSSLFKIASSI